MKIGIIAAMEEELVLLKEKLDLKEEVCCGQFTFHVGRINGVNVVLSRCGIGKVNAAVGATMLLENFKPDYLLNIGVAGGFSEQVEIGDVVLSTEARHYDADATPFEYEIGQIPQMPPNYEADTRLLSLARQVTLEGDDVAVHQGAILSGDAFIHTPGQVSYLSDKFPNAMAVEMEGAAIAQTGFLFNVPFLLIRSISDKVREAGNPAAYSQSLDKAAANSVQMALGILENIH
ncbi:5'-methylthioadenosine/adenosylhomocysteine nucleosidase [Pseudodesulfovibrio sp. zrk46]|uniref:5'-methylthioadenosine/adenosylhomocysteine nucleosidase n=1 Tax=Pseudodesulfovibrio sp. zrk46 TaxID=2725288 RepID=UPI001448E6E7|nr:5'-methylthioadenosine/adenosylhomocysteine nucleosidase [Pseudodesulfovibrio sp. zrk46]QJB57092.1 5'-methylthioadenosine/adenosylhomocysteine nucleosidase [Pseudodesulfovibrio sp. zrk46]